MAASLDFKAIRPNSEARGNRSYGVLKLVLRSTDYSWEFVVGAGEPFQDSGRDACVNAPTDLVQ